jgi:hypothetical protein
VDGGMSNSDLTYLDYHDHLCVSINHVSAKIPVSATIPVSAAIHVPAVTLTVSTTHVSATTLTIKTTHVSAIIPVSAATLTVSTTHVSATNLTIKTTHAVLLVVRGRTGSVQRCRTDWLGSGWTGSTKLGLVGLVVLDSWLYPIRKS